LKYTIRVNCNIFYTTILLDSPLTIKRDVGVVPTSCGISADNH